MRMHAQSPLICENFEKITYRLKSSCVGARQHILHLSHRASKHSCVCLGWSASGRRPAIGLGRGPVKRRGALTTTQMAIGASAAAMDVAGHAAARAIAITGKKRSIKDTILLSTASTRVAEKTTTESMIKSVTGSEKGVPALAAQVQVPAQAL